MFVFFDSAGSPSIEFEFPGFADMTKEACPIPRYAVSYVPAAFLSEIAPIMAELPRSMSRRPEARDALALPIIRKEWDEHPHSLDMRVPFLRVPRHWRV